MLKNAPGSLLYTCLLYTSEVYKRQHWHFVVSILVKKRIFWIIFRKGLHCCRTLPVREMPKRLFVWQDWHVKWDAVILSK